MAMKNSPLAAIISPQIWPRNSPEMAMRIPQKWPWNSPVWLDQGHHPLSRDGIGKAHRLALGENEMGMVH